MKIKKKKFYTFMLLSFEHATKHYNQCSEHFYWHFHLLQPKYASNDYALRQTIYFGLTAATNSSKDLMVTLT